MRWNFSLFIGTETRCSNAKSKRKEKKSNKLLFVWPWFCCHCCWRRRHFNSIYKLYGILCIAYQIQKKIMLPSIAAETEKKLHNQMILLAHSTQTHTQNHYQHNQYYCSLFYHRWYFHLSLHIICPTLPWISLFWIHWTLRRVSTVYSTVYTIISSCI